MTPAGRAHQARALGEARVLADLAQAPRAVKRAQAARIFGELKAMLSEGKGTADEREQAARPWWLADGR